MIIVDYLDFKIKQRHALLARTIGTKAEEESSYTHSHNLVISATASMEAWSPSAAWRPQPTSCTTEK